MTLQSGVLKFNALVTSSNSRSGMNFMVAVKVFLVLDCVVNAQSRRMFGDARYREEEKRVAKGPECSVKEDQEVDSADSMN